MCSGLDSARPDRRRNCLACLCLRWHVHCLANDVGAGADVTRERVVRGAMIGWLVLAALLVGLSIGRASDRDETVVTAQVSSAEHETEEGYFSLGSDATVLAKPGTDLYRFLARQNGHKVRITLTVVGGQELSRLDR
jgi:hypothetical protein